MLKMILRRLFDVAILRRRVFLRACDRIALANEKIRGKIYAVVRLLRIMSREIIKRRLGKSTVASCGAVVMIVCFLSGIGSGESGSYGATRLFGQQQTEKTETQEQIVYFSFPVGTEKAPILASPSAETYQTGVVSRGDEVEIYFRNNDGYCAIRPPQGSFSWVNGKFIQPERDSYGRVVSPSSKAIPSRVGAQTPEASSVAQVGLKNNQRVKIIGQTRLQDGSVWYKIAPPPGEFRWIRESDLARSEALSQLPSKLISRSEYLERMNSLENDAPRVLTTTSSPRRAVAATPNPLRPLPKNDDPFAQEIDLRSFESSDARPETLAQKVDVPSRQTSAEAFDRETFGREIAKLNADVFQTLQQRKPTDGELAGLQARAENLFENAPDDEERKLVQTTFDAITKAQIAMQRSSEAALANAQFPTGVDQFAATTPNVAPFGGAESFGSGPFIDQNGQVIDAALLNGQYPDGLQIVNGQIVGTPMTIDGAYVLGATIVNDEARTHETEGNAKESKSKPRLGFAFSRSNHPFQKSPRESNAPKPKSAASRMESSLAHLPGFQTDQKTTIVPPQNYSFAGRGVQTRSLADAKLAPGPLRGEIAQNAAASPKPSTALADASATQTRQGALVFQTPRLSTDQRLVNPGSGDRQTGENSDPNWRSIANAPSASPSSSTHLASYEESQNGVAGVRPTSAFTPMTSKSFDNFDASGVLVELSNRADGAPRYALLDSSGDSFDVVAYLDPDKSVALDRFVGQKVVVKGASGTVTVNGKAKKHIVVSSLFLLK